MPNTLTLKARYRNAKAERVRFTDMSPALRCMVMLAEYRHHIDDLRDCDDWDAQFVESSMAYVKAEFEAAREEMRRGFRRSASIAQLERLADNPTQVVA